MEPSGSHLCAAGDGGEVDAGLLRGFGKGGLGWKGLRVYGLGWFGAICPNGPGFWHKFYVVRGIWGYEEVGGFGTKGFFASVSGLVTGIAVATTGMSVALFAPMPHTLEILNPEAWFLFRV